jgi:hypothetical protein
MIRKEHTYFSVIKMGVKRRKENKKETGFFMVVIVFHS